MRTDCWSLDLSPFLIAKTSWIEVHLIFAVQSDSYHDNPTVADPEFKLVFSKGADLSEFLRAVRCIEQFASCVSGNPQGVESLKMSRYSDSEIEERLEGNKSISSHRVFRFSDNERPETKNVSLYESVVNLLTPEAERSFEKSLRSWIEAYAEIELAASLMARALKLQGEVSPDRLLNAWKCFESLPATAPMRLVEKRDAKAMGRLVEAELKRLGYEHAVSTRVTNAVSRVSLESNRDRFQRLLREVQSKFGIRATGDNMVGWLLKAYDLRGAAAHGGSAASKNEFESMGKSIAAVEAMNMLLLFEVLGLDGEEAARSRQNPVLAYYHRAVNNDDPSRY
jgi:hypothetical protein